MKPYFSVLIPAYNRAQRVREAVESVLAQTWRDFEIFVVDDGSTDGTKSTLARFGSRIHVIRQASQGPEIARNTAAARARGDYLVLLDSDDLLFPYALEIYANVVRSCDSPPLIIGSMSVFADRTIPELQRENESEIKALKFADYLSKDVPIALSSIRVVIRRSLFEEIGGFRRSTPATFHLDDFHLILKVGTECPCVVLLQPETVAYRTHAGNSIRDPRAMGDGVVSLIAAERRGEYPGGRDRRRDRYACIGGISLFWVFKSLQAGKLGQALRMFLKSAPMLAAAISRKIRLAFHEKTPPLVFQMNSQPPDELAAPQLEEHDLSHSAR